MAIAEPEIRRAFERWAIRGRNGTYTLYEGPCLAAGRPASPRSGRRAGSVVRAGPAGRSPAEPGESRPVEHVAGRPSRSDFAALRRCAWPPRRPPAESREIDRQIEED